jgi:hypothetical protein
MIKKFFIENAILLASCTALALVLGGSLWAFFALHISGGRVFILHFNDIRGITVAGDGVSVLGMGVFAALVVLMNFVIARELALRDRFLGGFLAALTLIFASLLFVGFIAIINVNV